MLANLPDRQVARDITQGLLLTVQRQMKGRPTILTRLLRPDPKAPIGSRISLDVDRPFEGIPPLVKNFAHDDPTPYEIIKGFKMSDENKLIWEEKEYEVRAN